MAYSQREIFSGSLIYAVGQVLTKASAFLLIPLYTRFLSPADYGVVGYAGVFLQVSATVLMLGFHGAVTRYVLKAEGDEEAIGVFLTTTHLFLAAVGVLVVSALLTSGRGLYEGLSGGDVPFDPIIRLTLWTALLQAANQLVITFFLALRRYWWSAILQVGLFVCLTAAVVYFVVIERQGALGQVRGLLVGNAMFLAIAGGPYLRRFRLGLDPRHIRYSLAFGLPIVVHLLSGALLTSADRLMLEGRVPLSALGVYTVAYQLGLAINVINIAMNNAWQPSYYEEMARHGPESERRIGATYRIYALVLTLLCTGGVVLGPVLYELITPAGYEGGGLVVGLVVIGYFFNGFYFFAGSPIFYFERTRFLPLVTVIATAVNVALNLMAIPVLGILGAALATTVAFLLQFLMIDAFARRIHEHHFDRRIVFRAGLLLLLTAGALYQLRGVSYAAAAAAATVAAVLVLRYTLPTEFAQATAFVRGGFTGLERDGVPK